MIQDYTYHSHTNFSDGKNTLEEMVAQAKKIGFSHIGISDHLIIHKNIKQSPSWQMMEGRSDSHIYKNDFKKALPEFQKHCDEIRKFSKTENFKVLIGFEVDFFNYDGWLEELKEFLSKLDYDYLISGNHFLFDEKCEKIYNIHKSVYNFCDDIEIKNLVSSHFKTISQAAESRLFKFIAHLDYVRKMSSDYLQSQHFIQEKTEVIKALKNNNIGAELSTKGLRKIGDFYPDSWFLQKIKEENIPVVISDDSHRTSELGLDFDKAESKLSELNIKNRIKMG